jgi:acetyltransferase-like isoleucine patch superfamily enzyme
MINKIIRRLFSTILHSYYNLLLSRNNKIDLGLRTILFSKNTIKGSGNKLKFGNDCTIRNTKIEIYGNNNIISFGEKAKVYEGLEILVRFDNCMIIVGDKSDIGSAKIQLGEKNTKVIIGKDCMLSRDIVISTSDFHSIIDLEKGIRINRAKDVIIGDHVWLGNGTKVNKGASIGKDSIVAARSLVPGKSFGINSLIGGIPSKLIKSNVNWDRKIL